MRADKLCDLLVKRAAVCEAGQQVAQRQIAGLLLQLQRILILLLLILLLMNGNRNSFDEAHGFCRLVSSS
jgi:hypothetical protein